MKKVLGLIICLLALSASAIAQEKKESAMYFGAIIGTKINDFNKHFDLDVGTQLSSFSIGAGSSWTRNNYVIGFEFVYSAAQKDNTAGQIQYVGFSNMLSFGYNITRSKTWKVEPNIGIVLNNNQVIIQDELGTSFQNLTNNPLSGNIGLNLRLIGGNGLFTGLKIGYIMPFAGDTEWKNTVADTDTSLKDNLGTFYLQLNIGGLLKLSKNEVDRK